MATVSAVFGGGSGPILLSYVACTGSEYRLLECSDNNLEVGNCGHGQDAGVVCEEGTLKTLLEACTM